MNLRQILFENEDININSRTILKGKNEVKCWKTSNLSREFNSFWEAK